MTLYVDDFTIISDSSFIGFCHEPSPEVMSKVKTEKVDRSEFRATMKKKKYEQKEQIKSMAFGNGDVAVI